MKLALVHDYLTQKGGAERVVLSLSKAFPHSPVFTSLFNLDSTFPDFANTDVRTLRVNDLPFLRSRHRLALPLLASAFSAREIDADVVLCSSSGWAHGVHTSGYKIVYCHSPARWLYQRQRYIGERGHVARHVLGVLANPLLEWDKRAAASADRYIVVSSEVRERVRRAYGIDAEIIPPPFGIDPNGTQQPLTEIEPGFFLCVSRLLPYKNVHAIVQAFARLPRYKLVIVGTGPEEEMLRGTASKNVTVLGAVDDRQLRWLYAQCRGVVAASFEDFGLTPLEGAAFGKPAIVLRWGGFLDTVIEGKTGLFFDVPDAASIAQAIDHIEGQRFSAETLRQHAARYSEEVFIRRMRALVAGVTRAEAQPLSGVGV